MDWTIWNHGQVKWKCNEAQITKAYEGTPIDKLKYYHGNPESFYGRQVPKSAPVLDKSMHSIAITYIQIIVLWYSSYICHIC